MQGRRRETSGTPSDRFAPDCDRCAALCCVALAFDRSDLFAFDKPAGEPCRHLRGHACRIHDRLADEGFGGCVRYDCLGAGQLPPMMEAFRAMRRVRDLAQLLEAARRLPLREADAARRDALSAALAPPEGWTSASLAAFERGPLPAEVAAFLRALRAAVRPS